MREDVGAWFEYDDDSPYMLMVSGIKNKKRRSITASEEELFEIEKLNIPRSAIPAITHVDYSTRLQTVHEDSNPHFHAVISKFKEKTGCPMLVNTFFNVRGEPIVCTPSDAFKCFMGTELDVLAIGNYILYRDEQDTEFTFSYEHKYDLD